MIKLGYKIFRPVDWLMVGFHLLMTLLTLIFRENIGDWRIAFWKYLFSTAAMILLRVINHRFDRPGLNFISEWYPILSLPWVYSGTKYFVHALFPWTIDGLLHRADLALLGGDPTLFLRSLGSPWFSDLMQASYCLFFGLIFFSCLILYLKKGRWQFENLQMIILTALYGTYLLFILLPAHSPRFIYYHGLPLSGGWVTEQVGIFIGKTAHRGGAFPSGHAAASVAICVFMWRYARLWAPLFIIITLLLLLSTVYGGYHYVADLLAGFAYGGISCLLAILWNRHWRKSLNGNLK
ncbi:MAG: hypothetical protein A2509_07160 [Candidatus Edwardsbacteria bacterium RIFOXYD12_FULL_50_11]|uniref:Phosphatidic acid phosphatase type 2/haloperoxidase domain-containing protein n=1 Tax=Candidatus Edwardsbacteria bacterium GWF2_54_11 TaxID=1817851 RepID=A0A1F5RG36_9BACT|nr:MAG: hypothetical protein A2502_01265 [Candidatus Edwardsbacteria bacterium RifOxyC12_full_54_24]OGF08501.1 MAG: hypothetical protein A2273_06045 [Candidatus Edwardsbacteria bacterium RifOxyA12_full_54_48]OGF11435.1 MAG: hypothetical protein A3K15_03710 [Candidatus Edwardsbacteria bacterium GWE2_54_12]OGF13370.1 MAG: hypothetical protein A2024_00175 [Candidatus Edwardsbacteria bacterium GWF2_54_11]OGF16454.1 MAG: hypothetical protein A2509_07160 [Candidatus Edwardsbacteria bacterium RIFOXYD1